MEKKRKRAFEFNNLKLLADTAVANHHTADLISLIDKVNPPSSAPPSSPDESLVNCDLCLYQDPAQIASTSRSQAFEDLDSQGLPIKKRRLHSATVAADYYSYYYYGTYETPAYPFLRQLDNPYQPPMDMEVMNHTLTIDLDLKLWFDDRVANSPQSSRTDQVDVNGKDKKQANDEVEVNDKRMKHVIAMEQHFYEKLGLDETKPWPQVVELGISHVKAQDIFMEIQEIKNGKQNVDHKPLRSCFDELKPLIQRADLGSEDTRNVNAQDSLTVRFQIDKKGKQHVRHEPLMKPGFDETKPLPQLLDAQKRLACVNTWAVSKHPSSSYSNENENETEDFGPHLVRQHCQKPSKNKRLRGDDTLATEHDRVTIQALGSSWEHMFDKELSESDTKSKRLNRIVIPIRAIHYFPMVIEEDHLMLAFSDEEGTQWTFKYKYWKTSASFVFTTNWIHYIGKKNLVAGDVVSFYRKCDNPNEMMITYTKLSATNLVPNK